MLLLYQHCSFTLHIPHHHRAYTLIAKLYIRFVIFSSYFYSITKFIVRKVVVFMLTLSQVVAKANEASGGDNFQKAHFLFRWLCSEVVVGDYQNSIDSLAKTTGFTISDDDSPIDVFILSLQAGRSTYSSAYSRICQMAGLSCRQICGSLRGVGLRSAFQSHGKNRTSITTSLMPAHSWCLVTISEHHKFLGNTSKPKFS